MRKKYLVKMPLKIQTIQFTVLPKTVRIYPLGGKNAKLFPYKGPVRFNWVVMMMVVKAKMLSYRAEIQIC